MKNTDQDQQDPRNIPSVEDTTAMTIEFLRARLLSERSVSRSARQRADELAKKVVELEEQLKIVSLQRKMAEKATADVLAILEDNGASDISETLDADSDQETPSESKVEDGPTRDDDYSSSSLQRRVEHEELSGSDLDMSPVLGGSLSWKGRNDSPRTHEKFKSFSIRSKSRITSVGSSSPKHHIGRSCRQIKRRDSRPLNGEQDLESEPPVDSSQEIAPSTCSENSPDCSDNGHNILRDGSELHEQTVLLSGACSSSSQDHSSTENRDHNLDGYGKGDDMEKALECQAQLIDRYEAMEKAQREWEEKFRENNNSTPDSCDPGNHSDITEERDEIRALAPNLSNDDFLENERKSQVSGMCVREESSRVQMNSLGPSSYAEVEDLPDQNASSPSTSRSLAEEFTFPMANVKQSQESQENSKEESSHTSKLGQGLPDKPVSSRDGNNISDQETSGSKNNLYALVPHEPPPLNGVLEALKQARLSLEMKINELPLVRNESACKVIGSLSAPNAADRLEIPVGCAGLFRVPTDFAVEASSHTNFPGSSSQLRSANLYPSDGIPTAGNHQYFLSHEMDQRSSFSRDSPLLNSNYNTSSGFTRDGVPTNRFPETGWRNPGEKHYFDRYFDSIQSSAHVHNFPSPSASSSIYPNPNERFLKTFPGRAVDMPPGNQYSFYEDQIRPNMYR